MPQRPVGLDMNLSQSTDLWTNETFMTNFNDETVG